MQNLMIVYIVSENHALMQIQVKQLGQSRSI